MNHVTTTAQPFDGQWHQIVFVQQADGTRAIYIDGVADGLAIPAKAAGTFNLNDTTIGGILRASPGFWVTGLIDEVALWKRAITQAEITQLKNEGLTSVFPPLAVDLRSMDVELSLGGQSRCDRIGQSLFNPDGGASRSMAELRKTGMVGEGVFAGNFRNS